jgi:hypothetical protein
VQLEEGDKDEDHFHIPGLTLFEFRTQDRGPSYPLALVYPGADSDMLSLPDVNLNEGEVILHRADLAAQRVPWWSSESFGVGRSSWSL